MPGRNLLFFTFAAAVADRRGLSVLVGGMCETDFSGYPDCRDNTLKALQVALSLGLDTPMTIETPLMWLDKAQTWALTERLGGEPLIELVVEHTHSCYLGDREHRHAWGYGCGLCPSCDLRRKGYDAWLGAGACPAAGAVTSLRVAEEILADARARLPVQSVAGADLPGAQYQKLAAGDTTLAFARREFNAAVAAYNDGPCSSSRPRWSPGCSASARARRCSRCEHGRPQWPIPTAR